MHRAYHLNVPTVLKSKSLNLLEPSGPVQACNGIALPRNEILQLQTTTSNLSLYLNNQAEELKGMTKGITYTMLPAMPCGSKHM